VFGAHDFLEVGDEIMAVGEFIKTPGGVVPENWDDINPNDRKENWMKERLKMNYRGRQGGVPISVKYNVTPERLRKANQWIKWQRARGEEAQAQILLEVWREEMRKREEKRERWRRRVEGSGHSGGALRRYNDGGARLPNSSFGPKGDSDTHGGLKNPSKNNKKKHTKIKKKNQREKTKRKKNKKIKKR